MTLDNMDGKYYLYYDDSKTCSDDIILTIHGDNVTIPSSSDNGVISVKIDRKNKILVGSTSMSYTYKNDVLSFSGVQYVKEGSKTYKNLEK